MNDNSAFEIINKKTDYQHLCFFGACVSQSWLNSSLSLSRRRFCFSRKRKNFFRRPTGQRGENLWEKKKSSRIIRRLFNTFSISSSVYLFGISFDSVLLDSVFLRAGKKETKKRFVSFLCAAERIYSARG